MSKFFVTSDIHSYFSIFKKALDNSGFDPDNKDHWLIICGDCFDRGHESKELLNFIMSLERKIIIKGNHDILLEACCKRKHAFYHDLINGTCRTIQDISEIYNDDLFNEACEITWNELLEYRNALVNYFETQKYIFVHSWIPTISQNNGFCRFDKNWRRASNKRWNDATWGNPFELYLLELNKTGKTIVFGHWHCSAGHVMLNHCSKEFDENSIWEPCYAEGIIGIDRCTAHTGECNVIVLEDEFL